MSDEQKVDSPAAVADELESGQGAGADAEDLLTLEEAVQFLGTSKPTLKRLLSQGDLKGLKVGRQWRFRRADLIAYMERGPVAVAAAPQKTVEEEILFFAERLLATEESREAVNEEYDPDNLAAIDKITSVSPGATGSENRVAVLLNRILALGIRQGASDIHLESARQGGESFMLLRFRMDGVLHEIRRVPGRLQDVLVLRVKQITEMDLGEKRAQDGRCVVHVDGNDFDLRVSCLHTLFGASIVMRILDRGSILPGLDRLGLAAEDLARLRELIFQPQGMFITTGPTGSGKSTLLYSCLNELVGAQSKVITVEDPVEYILPYATQTQVQRKIGMTFSTTLRTLLRQDPDVIYVSQMRDLESAELALEAAVTGHIVFTVLHSTDAPSALIRLRDMGVTPFLIPAYVIGVVAQRLIRTICPHCKEVGPPALSNWNREQLLKSAAAGGYTAPSDAVFYRGRGCENCFQTGYKGRTGLLEVMVTNSEIGSAFLSGASAPELSRIAVAHGLRTLVAEGVRKAVEGITTLEEVRRVTMLPG